MLKNLIVMLAASFVSGGVAQAINPVATYEESQAETETTIWTGECVTGKWGKRVKILADKLESVQPMQKVIVEFTVAGGAESGKLDIKDSGQKTLPGVNATASNLVGCVYPAGTASSTFIVVPEDLDKFKGGIYVYGNMVVITAVKLGGIADESELPGQGGGNTGGNGDMPGSITTGDDNVTWTGEVNLGTDWSSVLHIKPANFRSVLGNGSHLIVDFKVNDDDTYGKLEIDFGNYEIAKDTDGSCTGLNADGCFDAGSITTTYEIADGDIANFNRRGMIIKGYNITLEKVVFTKGENAGQGGGNQGGGGNHGGGGSGTSGSVEGTDSFDATGYLWTGKAVFSSDWSTCIEIAPEKLQCVTPGMEMHVDFNVQGGASYGKMEIDYFDWSMAEATDKTATNTDSYACFQPGTVNTVYTIAAADAERFKSEGMRIKGTGLDVSKIAIGQLGQSAVEAVESDMQLLVEYFDLNGMKVETPARGIFIRRQGADVTKVVIR